MPRGQSGVIVFDMDDTIVDRESVFVSAQIEMLKTLRSAGARGIRLPSSISTLRRIDIELIRLHKGNHMYDFKELARGIWLHVVEKLSRNKAARRAFEENRHGRLTSRPALCAAHAHNKTLHNKMPMLLNSSKSVIRKLKREYLVILFTSGDRVLQSKVMRHHGFYKIFDAVVIRKAKNISTFREIKRLVIELSKLRTGRKPSRVISVGDRVSQDMIPARKAGFETIWIPGPYFPGNRGKWGPTHTASSLEDLPKILLGEGC